MQFFKRSVAKLCGFWWRVWNGPQQPHPPLFQLRAFWATVLSPLLIAGVFTFFIAQSLHFPDVLLTKEGFDNAYEYFKIPLWIAALSLPLAGFYASHHRSVQTVAQIERSDKQIGLTETKNNFENYFKHQEFFYETLESLQNETAIYKPIFEKKGKLYNLLFPYNSPEKFSPKINVDNEFINSLLSNIKNIEVFFGKDFGVRDVEEYCDRLFGVLAFELNCFSVKRQDEIIPLLEVGISDDRLFREIVHVREMMVEIISRFLEFGACEIDLDIYDSRFLMKNRIKIKVAKLYREYKEIKKSSEVGDD